MYGTLIGVGVLTAIVAYVLDYVLWTHVFTKGIGELSSISADKEQIKHRMGPMLATSFANTLVFGVAFTLTYAWLKSALWAHGVAGGMEFGTLLWLPTIAVAMVGNAIWLDKIRPALKANFWGWLIKLNVCGVAAALLIG